MPKETPYNNIQLLQRICKQNNCYKNSAENSSFCIRHHEAWLKKERKPFSSRQKKPPNHIYFIGTETGDKVKIGKSRTVSSRLRVLQTANPQKLVLLASVKAPQALEKILHQELKTYNVGGEWFLMSEAVKLFIGLAKSNSVDNMFLMCGMIPPS